MKASICVYCQSAESEMGDDQLSLLIDPSSKQKVLAHESCHDTATSNHENYEPEQV